jgi:hypothetical protein
MFGNECLECVKRERIIEEKDAKINTMNENLFQLKTKIIEYNQIISAYLNYRNENENLKKENESLKKKTDGISNPRYDLEVLKTKFSKERERNINLQMQNTQLTSLCEQYKSQINSGQVPKIEYEKLKKENIEKEKLLTNRESQIEQLKLQISEFRGETRSIKNKPFINEENKLINFNLESSNLDSFLEINPIQSHHLPMNKSKTNNSELKILFEENEYLKEKYQKYNKKYIKFKSKYKEMKSFLNVFMKMQKSFAVPGIAANGENFEFLNKKRDSNPHCVETEFAKEERHSRRQNKTKDEKENSLILQKSSSFYNNDIFDTKLDEKNQEILFNKIEQVDEEEIPIVEKKRTRGRQRTKQNKEEILNEKDKKEISKKKSKKLLETPKKETKIERKKDTRKESNTETKKEEKKKKKETKKKERKNKSNKNKKVNDKEENNEEVKEVKRIENHIGPIKPEKLKIDPEELIRKKEESDLMIVHEINSKETNSTALVLLGSESVYEKVTKVLDIICNYAEKIQLNQLLIFIDQMIKQNPNVLFGYFKLYFEIHLNLILKNDKKFIHDELKDEKEKHTFLHNLEKKTSDKYLEAKYIIPYCLSSLLHAENEKSHDVLTFLFQLLIEHKIVEILSLFFLINDSFELNFEKEKILYQKNFNKIYFLSEYKFKIITYDFVEFLRKYFSENNNQTSKHEVILSFLKNKFSFIKKSQLSEIDKDKINFASDIVYLEIYQCLLFTLKIVDDYQWIFGNIFKNILWNEFVNSKEQTQSRSAIIFYVSFLFSFFYSKNQPGLELKEETGEMAGWLGWIFNSNNSQGGEKITIYDKICALSYLIDIFKHQKEDPMIKTAIQLCKENTSEIIPEDFLNKVSKLK